MYHLFLDDERRPGDVTWVRLPFSVYEVVRNYDEFVNIITNHGIPKFVSFDHDLAYEHYEVMLKEVNASKYTAFVPDEEGGLNLTFDYGKEKTGYDCAKFLVDQCINLGVRFPEYEVHSMNPVGSKRIRDYIEWSKSKIKEK